MRLRRRESNEESEEGKARRRADGVGVGWDGGSEKQVCDDAVAVVDVVVDDDEDDADKVVVVVVVDDDDDGKDEKWEETRGMHRWITLVLRL